MAQIEGFRIKNFKALKDIEVGRLWNTWNDKKKQPLTPLTVVIGKNGVGKSSLFDAFGFLADCLKIGVEDACDKRGGYDRILSKGQTPPIEFEIYYKENISSRPITYEVAIALDSEKRPYVLRERLRQRRRGQSTGYPFSFLRLEQGKGVVWKGKEALEAADSVELSPHEFIEQIFKSFNFTETNETEKVELADKRRLGIVTLGSLKENTRIVAFRRFMENWYLSYFTPDAARGLPLAGPQKQLNVHGDNLGNVVQFMEREYPKRFQAILKNISAKIPGIDKIDTQKTEDGRLLLCFNDKGFKDPFFAQQMSDGTLKIFAYLLMLENPSPPPFICIEEPENGLYHKLLETLAVEFRTHATGKKGGAQLFITTHQPYLVNALKPDEVWILEKQKTGFSTIKRASDNELVRKLVEEELPLGGLWYSDYLDNDGALGK